MENRITVTTSGKLYFCDTKEKFYDANFIALIELHQSGMATSVLIKLLQEVKQKADELYGETNHTIKLL